MSKPTRSAPITYPAGMVRDEATDYGPCLGCEEPDKVLRKVSDEDGFKWRCDGCIAP